MRIARRGGGRLRWGIGEALVYMLAFLGRSSSMDWIIVRLGLCNMV